MDKDNTLAAAPAPTTAAVTLTGAEMVIQALRDQGIVRQVHAAQSVGRQIVTQKRIERQQNPNRNNPRATPPRPPGPQRQNGLPPRPASPQPPGSPNRQGLHNPPCGCETRCFGAWRIGVWR